MYTVAAASVPGTRGFVWNEIMSKHYKPKNENYQNQIKDNGAKRDCFRDGHVQMGNLYSEGATFF